MFDIKTVLTPNLFFDWAIDPATGDLATDEGLDTWVINSLFIDRLANADDVIPDGSGDRRGWWGDAYLPPLADGSPDHLGSRMWLLARALQTNETAQRAQTYLQEALGWMVGDGLAAAIDVPLPIYPARGLIQAVPKIVQQSATGIVDVRYKAIWDMTRMTPNFFGLVVGGI